MPWLMHRLRLWDLASSFRVDYFIANSSFVQKRIKKFYQRNSDIIFPPINIDDFKISDTIGDYYLMVGQLVSYKNTHLTVEAFNANQKKLIIIGEGAELKKLQQSAGSNITFLASQPFDVIKAHYSCCKALIFPGIEDFGMVPVEAMASGRPVIALKKGGALDTVIDNVTGVFFEHENSASLNDAITYFEKNSQQFIPKTIKEHAKQFDQSVFKEKIKNFIDQKLKTNNQ
jgi:glycosyltransferase involved in cell wall biosynthesis